MKIKIKHKNKIREEKVKDIDDITKTVDDLICKKEQEKLSKSKD